MLENYVSNKRKNESWFKVSLNTQMVLFHSVYFYGQSYMSSGIINEHAASILLTQQCKEYIWSFHFYSL